MTGVLCMSVLDWCVLNMTGVLRMSVCIGLMCVKYDWCAMYV